MFSINTFVEGKPQKLTSAITLSFFAWVFFLSPNAFAVKEELTKEDKRQAAIERALDKTPEHAYARRLQKLKDFLTYELPLAKEQAEKARKEKALGEVKAWFNQYGLFLPPVLTDDQKETIIDLKEEINALAEQSHQGFDEVAEHIKLKDLPEIALERHQAVVKQVDQRFTEFNSKVDALLKAEDRKAEDKALKSLTQFIEQQQFSKTHDKTNLEHMPFGTPKGIVRKPHTDAVAQSKFLKMPLVQLAALNATGLLENTKVPAPEDLAENIEIQLTDAIKAKAAELNHNPVEIYTWVHNNVQYIPSFGSIQGADYTLQSLKGNSFDTASLLIALLRASDIPARYAYGTVDIPLDKIRNWVGGVDNVPAASNILGQGGVPHTLLRFNGQDKAIRMEHVWVEAFVDFEPSRGVNNIEGDNWIPMDASFKQYEFTEGMDIESNVSFDADALVQTIQNNVTINEAEGWVQNVPQADIEAQLTAFQAQVQDYIEAQNPDATLGEVLGLQEIKVKPSQPLAAGLPYQLVTAKQTFSTIPAHLRHTFSYSLSQSGYAASMGSSYFTVQKSLPELAGKKLALSYKPSTQADEDIILSYLPEVPEGEELDPSQLPSSLPGYLINMTAEFTIDGEVVASAAAGKMGGEVRDTMQLRSPTGTQFPATGNNIVVGQYHAIGLDLQGISAGQLAELQANMEGTKAKLETAGTDATALDGLTKHDVVGDYMQGTAQNYFALNDLQDRMLDNAGKVKIFRLPSYGKFSTNLSTIYSWGIPKNVEFSGLVMDMDFILSVVGTAENNAERQTLILKQIGSRLSIMEHMVPEQIFSTDNNQVHAVSAVKAIQVASELGQRIYNINSNNIDDALSAINLNSSTEQEIRNAVNSGKEVTTHTHVINYEGIITAGYIILDPLNGTGAYKVSSGEDGSFLDALKDWVLPSIVSMTNLKRVLSATPALFARMVIFLILIQSVLGIIKTAVQCSNLETADRVSVMAAYLLPLMIMLGIVAIVVGLGFPLIGIALAMILPWLLRPLIVEWNLAMMGGCRN